MLYFRNAQSCSCLTISLADLAPTLVMMDAGIVAVEAGRELLAALLKLRHRPADFQLDPSQGDLYTNREAWCVRCSAQQFKEPCSIF